MKTSKSFLILCVTLLAIAASTTFATAQKISIGGKDPQFGNQPIKPKIANLAAVQADIHFGPYQTSNFYNQVLGKYTTNVSLTIKNLGFIPSGAYKINVYVVEGNGRTTPAKIISVGVNAPTEPYSFMANSLNAGESTIYGMAIELPSNFSKFSDYSIRFTISPTTSDIDSNNNSAVSSRLIWFS